eukprot:3351276-Pleurochrysis_carterae.AAC.2
MVLVMIRKSSSSRRGCTETCSHRVERVLTNAPDLPTYLAAGLDGHLTCESRAMEKDSSPPMPEKGTTVALSRAAMRITSESSEVARRSHADRNLDHFGPTGRTMAKRKC